MKVWRSEQPFPDYVPVSHTPPLESAWDWACCRSSEVSVIILVRHPSTEGDLEAVHWGLLLKSAVDPKSLVHSLTNKKEAGSHVLWVRSKGRKHTDLRKRQEAMQMDSKSEASAAWAAEALLGLGTLSQDFMWGSHMTETAKVLHFLGQVRSTFA